VPGNEKDRPSDVILGDARSGVFRMPAAHGFVRTFSKVVGSARSFPRLARRRGRLAAARRVGHDVSAGVRRRCL